MEDTQESNLWQVCPEEQVEKDEQAEENGGKQARSSERIQERVAEEEDDALLPVSCVLALQSVLHTHLERVQSGMYTISSWVENDLRDRSQWGLWHVEGEGVCRRLVTKGSLCMRSRARTR